MSFTYSGDPDASDTDAVRFLIRDTAQTTHLFEDAEIKWAVSTEANIYMAAAMLCDTLIVKGGGVKIKKVGELMIQYDPSFYKSLSGSLRARGSGHQVPYAGGISVADKQAQSSDSDWVQPSIQRNLDNNPAAPQPATPPVNGPGNPLTGG